MISLEQISALCNVSIGTASKALRGKPGIKEETRQRILTVAKQHNYRPNRLVHAIQSGRSMTVGITCSQFGDEFAGLMVGGMLDVLYGAEYDPIVISWELSIQEGARALRTLNERRVDGILMFPMAHHPPLAYLEELRAFSGPVVVVDQKWPGCPYDFVGSSDREGADQATEHLISLGHRKIAVLHLAETSTGEGRLQGFVRAMQRHGVAVHEKWMIEVGPYGSEAAYQRVRSLLSSEDRPTALVAFNDVIAMQALAAATDLGLQIPRDLSITGFADLRIASHLRPRLTTVQQEPRQIGRRAAQRLLEQIDRADLKPGERPAEELLPVRLIVRESTAPAVS